MKHTYRKRLIRPLSWLLAMLLIGAAVIPTITVISAVENDIARGKRAFACHQESASLTPELAVDGKSGTRFAAGGGCAHDTRFVLDLGGNYDLSAVHINWEAAHPSSYVLEISEDGQTYTKLKQVDGAAAGWVKTDVAGTGRFLRIRELTRALAQYGFSIYDLEVYGMASSVKNEADYLYLQTDSAVKYGTLTLSKSGFVKKGEEVTVSATPMTGGRLLTLTVGGEDVTSEVKNGSYTFTATADTTVSGTFASAPSDRYECEDAIVLDHDGKTEISGTVLADSSASGGKVAGGTGGKYFVFENVVEANCVQIAYASPNTNNMSLYIRYRWEDDYHSAGLIHFSTSNSWNMNSSYIATSSLVYIPAGSDIMIRPNVDCNLDCLWLTSETSAKPADAPENVVTATDIYPHADKDLMATYGHSCYLPAYHLDDFTVPEGKESYNVLSISYRAEELTVLTIEKENGGTIGRLVLDPTLPRTFATAGLRTSDYEPGEKLTLVCQSGALWIDYIEVNYAPEADVVTVPALPEKGDRLTVSLDGTWDMGIQQAEELTLPETAPDVDYINAAPVPGLWHSAAFSFGDYVNMLTWYKKTVVLNEAPTEQVLLYIEQAQYGRHIYVNGQYVDSYHYNYSHSYTDITDYLREGENEIAIMLGAWVLQFNDRNTPTHVLYDGESTEDEPGITGSVSLIFNAAPEVGAVQTLPHPDEGTVQVQVNLQNRGDTDVTTDVTFTVYELGLFENGVAMQPEKQVGTFTLTGVTVKAGGVATVKTDAIGLSDWSRDKCWTPDSPFLYRVEIQTSGDTYSSRFGMRTFDFDPVTKYPRLNGETFFMMGTNVAIERYYDDPLCGTTPWEEDWIRKLYSEYKDVNWNSFRVHLGNANEKWFDIADEMGFMIIDEYPQWGDQDGCTAETYLPEIYAWIDLRANHPSLIMFDSQNEAGDAFTDEHVRRGREYDLQKRPWDNGWRPPVGENDPIMGCHPYHIGGQGISGLANIVTSKPVLTMADIALKYEDYKDHPFLLEEHGEYWINREGAAMSGTAGTWNSALPGATNAERDAYYAELMAAQIEAYRAGRAYVGLLFFCGLTSSNSAAQGITGDILSPDVSTAEALQIRPYTKELLGNAFADLGISIGFYDEELTRGEQVRLPITLTNDTGKDITELPVTVKIMSGDTVLYAERFTMSVSARTTANKGSATETRTVTVPAYRDYCKAGNTLVVTASYELDGETVYSQRKWKIERNGDYTDDPLPTYDWLNGSGPVESETETAVVTPPESETKLDTTDAPVIDKETAPTTAAPDEPRGGCKSAISGALLLTSAASAAIVLAKRRREEE